MALVLTILLFTAIVAGSVVLVVRTALRARITDDDEAVDPLDEYVDTARASFAETRETFAKLVRARSQDEFSTPTVRTHSADSQA